MTFFEETLQLCHRPLCGSLEKPIQADIWFCTRKLSLRWSIFPWVRTRLSEFLAHWHLKRTDFSPATIARLCDTAGRQRPLVVTDHTKTI